MNQGLNKILPSLPISWSLSLLVIVMIACQKKTQVTPAFYHWQTELALSQMEQAYLDSLNVKKLYAKFFDVDWDATRDMPIPLAEIKIEKLDAEKLEIVPCIFITNETFKRLADDKISWFADHVSEKLNELWKQLPHQKMQEVQFDCDWTASTRDRFFRFIEIFKAKNADIQLSATIRLHQLRDYQTTGVPPVDKGMLMFYNTGDVENWNEENSILNLQIARQYLSLDARNQITEARGAPSSIHYPLPLDVALPIFAWGVLFRDGRMIRLINNLRSNDLTDTTRFLKIGSNRFEVIKSTYLEGYYLYKGDQIRTEAIDTQLLLQASDLLSGRLKNRNLTVAFYHLDTTTIKYFPHEALESVCEKFNSH